MWRSPAKPPSQPLSSSSTTPSKPSVKISPSSQTTAAASLAKLPRIIGGLFTPNPIGKSKGERPVSQPSHTLLTMSQSRERLPTLFEVLNRMPAPPVDLWTFYEFMRTNYRGVEYLDFWLDAANHVKLCKLYVEGQVVDSGSSAGGTDGRAKPPLDPRKPVFEAQPRASDPQDSSNSTSFGRESFHSMPSPSSSLLLDMLGENSSDRPRGHGVHRSSLGADSIATSGSGTRRDTIARLSALLDDFQSKNGRFGQLPSEEALNDPEFAAFIKSRPSLPPIDQMEESDDEEADIGMVRAPALGAPYERVPGGSPTQRLSPRPSPVLQGRAAPLNAPFGGPLSSVSEPVLQPPNLSAKENLQGITLEDIYASVNSIVLRYLTPGAEREILLPDQMARNIRDAAQGAGRRDPALFNEARDYVFEVMEREAYPAFLASAALRNIRPVSSLFRLLFGMIALFAAFWLSFVFILLDWRPKSTRLWIILPFGVGWYLTLSSLYNLDFILGLFGYSEVDGVGIAPVKEAYVAKLIRSRSALVAVLTVVVSACFVVLFALVPGHRL